VIDYYPILDLPYMWYVYMLWKNLTIFKKYTPSIQLFDLQSGNPEGLFGIYVSSRYGRTFSKFHESQTNNSVIDYYPILDLPYMCYVNASAIGRLSYHYYFALLNNFPGQSNSTLKQKIMFVNLAYHQDFAIFDVPSRRTIFHYISFNKYGGKPGIYVLGQQGDTVVLSYFPQWRNARITLVQMFSFPGFKVGPMVASDLEAKIYFFMTEIATNSQWLFSVAPDDFTLTKTPLKGAPVVAASYVYWNQTDPKSILSQ